MALQHSIEGWHELDPMARPGRAMRSLMIALVAVYFLQGPLGLDSWAVLMPQEALLGGRLWQLLSYGLLHQNLLHLIFNLLGLWVFGTELERLWGSRAFLVYISLCVAGAGLAHSVLDPLISQGDPVGVMGFSGGVYGLLAAFGLIFRRRQLLFLGLIPVRAGVLALVFALLALFSGVAQSGDSTAHFAHLGGMLTGVAVLYSRPVLIRFKLWRHRRRMLRHLRRATVGNPAGGPPGVPAQSGAGTVHGWNPAGLSQEQIKTRVDDLLGKVSRGGLSALSQPERAFLDEASKWLRAQRERGK